MTKTTPQEPSRTEFFKQMREFVAFNPTIGPGIEHFWCAQEKILNESETFARNWFERRHAATRSAMKAARGMTRAGSTEPAEAAKALADWQSRSMELVAGEICDWFDLCWRCSGHLTRAEVEAGEEAPDKVAKQVVSGNLAKESVPV